MREVSKNELKLIKSLKLKKFRTRENLFLIEGIKNVNEVISSDFEIVMICATLSAAEFISSDVSIISDKKLNEVSTLSTNQDCIAVAKIKQYGTHEIDFQKPVIALDGVGDPGNVGTIVRALDWFGYSHVLCSHDCADFYNPKTIASSMGSFTRIKPVYTDLVSYLTSFTGRVMAMDLEGEPLSQEKSRDQTIYVMGSESHGLSAELKKTIDRNITIQGSGGAESLNVAMATSMLLYQLSLSQG
ncbi:MAG: RNA methyltransferase [Cyclobacteriaceae bacterium]